VQIGSPPRWDDAPAEFQADLAALDRLDDKALWYIARSRTTVGVATKAKAVLPQSAPF